VRTLLFLIVAAVGCGGDDGPGSLGSSDLTLRELCNGIATAMCDKSAECAPPGVPGCVESFTAACCPASVDCDQLVPESDARDRLDECIDDFRALSCAQLGVMPASCQ
jgi:hypothetical protein